MEISYSAAVWMVLLTSFMWGFWHQFVKRISSWPLPAFMIWMFTSGALVVWGCILAFQGSMVPEGILTAIGGAREYALLAVVCGAGFAIGMQIQLYVVSKMGLIYSTSVVSTSSILLGTLFSSILGGIPEDTSFVKILFGALILLAATLTCQRAGVEKDRHLRVPNETSFPSPIPSECPSASAQTSGPTAFPARWRWGCWRLGRRQPYGLSAEPCC